jgi:hypothetical protein
MSDITLEELENQPFVQSHKDLYKTALERGKYSDKSFWEELDPDVRDSVKSQMRQYGSKPVWRMIK